MKKITKKSKINALAWLFYRAHGYNVEEGHDFSKAHHPQEKAMWNLAKTSHTFWEIAGLKDPPKKSKNPEEPQRCELCGSPVRVVGSVTMHYEPIEVTSEELLAKGICPCGSESSEGCSVTGCALEGMKS